MDPTAKVGRQMGWALGRRLSASQIGTLLTEVHLKPEVANAYPHQLSGGMAQRVSIALALAHEPAAVIADEPTASLDASIRVEILELLVGRARERDTSVVIITHDLASVRRFCNRVVVLYGGRVVEESRSEDLFEDPKHPYTRALLSSALGREQPGEVVRPIQGQPPLLRGACPGCAFSGRCPTELDHCSSVRPEHRQVDAADVLCHLYDALPVVSSAGSTSRREVSGA
jgi:oligopeptide/dipeptide ABC transporter ATP-binding protein